MKSGDSCCPPPERPSGFTVLLHTAFARRLEQGWGRLNGLVRPLVPVLNLWMILATGAVFCIIAFANWHLPCWGDEIYMVDPAFCRTVRGVWQTHGFHDALSVVPYAPNYPLLTNLLRIPIACFGLNYWVLRTINLLLGVVPVLALAACFRRRGIFQSRSEVLQAVYCVACLTFFHWSIQIRPEALLVAVVSLLVFAWASDRPVLLFLSALLVPLCGLQWNVLLLPAALHWLVFGGRIRNPLLVGGAFVLATGVTFAAYHLLGMWPSYLQEAARVSDGTTFSHALTLLRNAYAHGDFGWLVAPGHIFLPVYFFLGTALASRCLVPAECGRLRAPALFLSLSFGSVLVVLSFVHMMGWYLRVLVLPMALSLPLALRPLRDRHLPLFLLFSLLPLLPVRAFWAKIWTMDDLYAVTSDRPYVLLHDEASLARWTGEMLTGDDVVLDTDGAYFAVRGRCKDYYRFRNAHVFELPPSVCREITAVIVADIPIWDYRRGGEFSVDETMADLGRRWGCAFVEEPVPPPRLEGALRFRFFRPVFPPDTAGAADAGDVGAGAVVGGMLEAAAGSGGECIAAEIHEGTGALFEVHEEVGRSGVDEPGNNG